MSEVQKHGFSFEQWIRDTFFESYEGVYSQKWDVPSESNRSKLVPAEFRGLPVSIKTTKHGSPVNLGDALRQFQVDDDFVMICGIWKQANRQEKLLVAIGAALFRASAWRQLWSPLKLAELKELDLTVKDRGISYVEARLRAKQWQALHKPRSEANLRINPKIDSKEQRRVQCSLPFATYCEVAGLSAAMNESGAPAAELFGKRYPGAIKSPPRTFRD
jgi:hypothetical protein